MAIELKDNGGAPGSGAYGRALEVLGRGTPSSGLAGQRRHVALAGVPVAPGDVRLLELCDAEVFTRPGLVALFEAAASPERRRALGHLRRISTAVLAQLPFLPNALVLPSLLETLHSLPISPARWQAVGRALDAAGQWRAALLQLARAVRSAGDLWDLFARCHEAALDAAGFAVKGPLLGEPFRALDTPARLRREALSMRNCLRERVQRAASQGFAYYAWEGDGRATVELVQAPAGWRLRALHGRRNGPVGVVRGALIRHQLALAGVPHEPEAQSREQLAAAAARREVSRLAASLFPLTQRAQLRNALQEIRGRSRDGDDAFCICEIESGHYVQFLDRPEAGLFYGEIASHRCVDWGDRLTESAVDALAEWGFMWPATGPNFWSEVPVGGRASVDRLADFALGALHLLFGHQPGSSLDLTLHLPAFPDGTKADFPRAERSSLT